MAIKFFFVFFGALCMIAYNDAAPAQSFHLFEQENVSSKGFHLRLGLMHIILEEFFELFAEIVLNVPFQLNKILADSRVADVETETMEIQITILKNYVNAFMTALNETKPNIFESIEDFEAVVDKFNSTKNENLPNEAIIIEKLIVEKGLTNIREDVYSHFRIFLEKKFEPTLEEYFRSLEEKEKNDERELKTWYDGIKAETNVQKKMKTFESFLEVKSKEL